MTNSELCHYGILGMKWGVRRTEAQLARARGKKSSDEDASDDYKKAHDSKSVKSMSDSELRERINRLQMEKQYSQLSKKEVSAGTKFVKDVLVNAAKQTASSYASKYMSKAVGAAINGFIKGYKKR